MKNINPKTRLAGNAKISQIACHWHVCDDTARAILRDAGLPDMSSGAVSKYSWEDIWRMEGDFYVPPHLYSAFRAPLLTAKDAAQRDPSERSERSWRRYFAAGELRIIRLTPNIVRIRECVLDEALRYV